MSEQEKERIKANGEQLRADAMAAGDGSLSDEALDQVAGGGGRASTPAEEPKKPRARPTGNRF